MDPGAAPVTPPPLAPSKARREREKVLKRKLWERTRWQNLMVESSDGDVNFKKAARVEEKPVLDDMVPLSDVEQIFRQQTRSLVADLETKGRMLEEAESLIGQMEQELAQLRGNDEEHDEASSEGDVRPEVVGDDLPPCSRCRKIFCSSCMRVWACCTCVSPVLVDNFSASHQPCRGPRNLQCVRRSRSPRLYPEVPLLC